MTLFNPKILVIVPAFNECGNIGRTVQEIHQITKGSVDVLVIDDGSHDDTADEALRAGGMVVSLPYNLGIGAAVQTGFQYARLYQYDIAVQIDGDGQHDPAFLDKIIDPIRRGDADMVVGSRFLEKIGFQSSFSRRLGINFFVHLINFLTGVKVNDPTSGFRAYNKQMIALFSEYYPHDFPEPEAIVVAQQANARIIELPVVMRPREAGSSSIRYFKTFYYMIKVTLAILLHMIREKRNS